MAEIVTCPTTSGMVPANMLQLTQSQFDEIHRTAASEYPHECCGILVGVVEDGQKTAAQLVVTENQRQDSLRNRYLIDPAVVYRLESELRGTGKAILGFFHSHPDAPARPSLYDQEHAWPWYSYLIVSVTGGKAADTTVWQLRPDRSGFDEEAFQVLEVEVS
ncbi:MAG: M67 family peptidase [Acidobacteria bacterium]|nr:MAG: M67 family peptidase [Acidobacteriota bacterium]